MLEPTAIFTDSERIQRAYPLPINSSEGTQNTNTALLKESDIREVLEVIGWKQELITQYLAITQTLEPISYLAVTEHSPEHQIEDEYIQGRGFHHPIPKDIYIDETVAIPDSYYMYVKGQGALQTEGNNKNNPSYPTDITFFESSGPSDTAIRRILGTVYADELVPEWLTNMLMLGSYLAENHIESLQTVFTQNIPVALPPIKHTYLSEYYKQQAEITDVNITAQEKSHIQEAGIGSIVYLTPDFRRQDAMYMDSVYGSESVFNNPLNIPVAFEKFLYLAELGFCYEVHSSHFKQVLLHMSTSKLPFMDYADILPLETVFDPLERAYTLATSLFKFFEYRIEETQNDVQFYRNNPKEKELVLKNMAEVIKRAGIWEEISVENIQGILLLLPAEIALLLIAKESMARKNFKNMTVTKNQALAASYSQYLGALLDATALAPVILLDKQLAFSQRNIVTAAVDIWETIKDIQDPLQRGILCYLIMERFNKGRMVSRADLGTFAKPLAKLYAQEGWY